MVLYGFDKVADAGLGEAKLVSGGGKALGLYDFQKDFKFFYIHTWCSVPFRNEKCSYYFIETFILLMLYFIL